MDNNHFNGDYNPYGQPAPPNLAAAQNPGQQQQQSAQQQSQAGGLASFGSLSAAGQQQNQQQQQSPQHPTLPPLQGQNGNFSYSGMGYAHPGSQSQTPTTPHTPSQAGMGGQQNAYNSPMAGAGSMLPPSGLNNPYVTQGMMYPSSAATSMPPSTSSAGLPALRPMPPTGVNGLPSLANPGHMGQLGQQPSFMQSEEQPTHVVGSQGRRGILPSAPGRPNPPAQGTATTKSMIPQKDADGKYPCPHCNKTYLHAKHLKRHLLRHTGDRPYMCHLCKDTFSRSDILKRHFQKCSLRRGNPTGANHLAHQRRNTNSGNRLSIGQQEGPIGLAGMTDVAGSSAYNANVVGSSPNVNGDISARSSRANSLMGAGSISHRSSLQGLGILGSNAPNADQMQQQGTSAPYQPSMNAYAMHNNTNNQAQMPSNYAYNTQQQMNGNPYSAQNPQQMSFLGHQSSRFSNSQVNNHQQTPSTDGNGVDWTRMFTQSGQDGFIGNHSVNVSSQGNNNIKTEPDAKNDFSTHNDFSNDSFLGSLYSHPGGFGGEDTDHGIPGFPNWSVDDPLQAKVDSLMQHCFPNGTEAAASTPAAQLLQTVLKIENVKHFAEHYTSYQGHWPILHMPTFKLTDANNNLVLAILCIGAVYSPKFTVHQTRQLMEFVKAIIFSSCTIYNRTLSGDTHRLGEQAFEIEELQALSMLQTMFTWHGDPAQRQGSRSEFPTLVRIARAMNLLDTVAPGHYAYSMLHAGRPSQANQYRVENWNWHGWLEQEKRNRALYQLLVTDAAMVMYFNSAPQFEPLDICLVLPADDAAWDASSPTECANALGLNGPHAQAKNMTGTRKAIQPTMRDALRTLLDQYNSFQPGTTNVYSKFMLIHALIIRIIVCQKALLQPDGQFNGFNLGLHGSAPATPLSQNDWLEQHAGGSGNISTNNSGHNTPTDCFSPKQQQNMAAQMEKKRLGQALEKWKRFWDTDMEIQYPPSAYQQRRFGFSRDGVHFFYLGRSFLQSQQASDFNVPGDVRFRRVMALLKRIKSMVVGDNETKGQDIGSVGDIDDQYGLDNLTLDMKLLFRPYNSQVDSPVAGVQTHTL